MSDAFQPTMLGFVVPFEDETEGMITDETEDQLYIEAEYFTGWISKEEFRECWRVPE